MFNCNSMELVRMDLKLGRPPSDGEGSTPPPRSRARKAQLALARRRRPRALVRSPRRRDLSVHHQRPATKLSLSANLAELCIDEFKHKDAADYDQYVDLDD